MERLWTVGALLSVAAACGGGDDGGPTPVEVGGFCEAYVQAVCDAALRCACGVAVADVEARCPELAAPTCPLAEGTALRASVDDGSVVYDATAAGRYLEALGEGACDDRTVCASSGPCLGLSAEGEPCGENRGCAAGLTCFDGSCRSSAPLGATCTEHAECESGRCAEGACAPEAADGEPCTEHGECESGRCDFTRGSCRPREGLEGLCTAHVDCQTGYCDRDLELGAGNCRERRADGEDCDEDPQCLGGACIDGVCAAAVCDVLG